MQPNSVEEAAYESSHWCMHKEMPLIIINQPEQELELELEKRIWSICGWGEGGWVGTQVGRQVGRPDIKNNNSGMDAGEENQQGL